MKLAIILTFLLIAVAGCATVYDPHVVDFEKARWMARSLRRGRQEGTSFTGQQLIMLLGKPDHRWRVAELGSAARPEHDAPFGDELSMAHLQAVYEQALPEGAALDPETLRACEVWVYRWKEPEDITFAWSYANCYDARLSYFFVLEGYRVVAGDAVMR
jgi:hypothetical protein